MKIKRYLEKNTGLFLLLPAVIILFIVVIYPLIYSLYLSFHSYPLTRLGEKTFVGIKNYKALFSDVIFWQSIKHTLMFVSATVCLELLLGLGIALAVNREFRHMRFVTFLFLIPMMIIPVVVGVLWKFMYKIRIGLFNYVLSVIGIPQQAWVTNPSLALLSIIIADIWQWTPFMFIILLAGLTNVPQQVYETAKIDGASSWQIFKYLTLPLLKPVILVAILLRTIDAFKMFDKLFILTRGGPGTASETLTFYTYRYGFLSLRMGYASASSYILVFVNMGICLLIARLVFQQTEA